jgi:hypothetical protein
MAGVQFILSRELPRTTEQIRVILIITNCNGSFETPVNVTHQLVNSYRTFEGFSSFSQGKHSQEVDIGPLDPEV